MDGFWRNAKRIFFFVTIFFFVHLAFLYLFVQRTRSVEYLPDLPKFTPIETFYEAFPIDSIIKLSRNGEPFCTGFVIDRNYIMTAAHCLGGMQYKLQKKTLDILDNHNNVVATGIPAGLNNRIDVGIVYGDFSELPFAKVEFYKYPPLEKASTYKTCGYPYLQKKLSCVPYFPNGNFHFSIHGIGMGIPGMSGGPMIDMKSRTVIGVNSAMGPDGFLIAPTLGVLGAFGIEP